MWKFKLSPIRSVGDHLLFGPGVRILQKAKLDSTDTSGTCLSKQRGSTKKLVVGGKMVMN